MGVTDERLDLICRLILVAFLLCKFFYPLTGSRGVGRTLDLLAE